MTSTAMAMAAGFLKRTGQNTYTTEGAEQDWRDYDENQGYDGAMLNFLIELHAMEVTNSG